MEKTNKKIIILAVVLSLVTCGFIFSYIKKIETANSSIEYLNIFVAAKNIDAKTAILVTDLKEVKVEKSQINSMAITNKDEIIGKTTKENIYEGEQILTSRLADVQNSGLIFQIPKGKRAITINVNEASAVGYFVNIGDNVDVLVTLEKDIQDPSIPTIAKTIINNVKVLGVGQEKDPAQKPQDKPQKAGINNASPGDSTTKTITLAVTLEEAEKIAIAEQIGSLRLTLRSVGDENVVNTIGVTRSDLVR